jgi:2-methylisocitrate lyase-like PEP mutase family enzyme
MTKAERFKSLHEKSGFIMPNAWDAGSAVMLVSHGFPAIATTSAGIAFSLAKGDYAIADAHLAVSRDEMFARIREIVAAVSVPVNGDLEAGYGDAPEAVVETIRLAMDTGLAGGNIEDRDPKGGLYEEDLAIDRIKAAREAIDAKGSPFVLTARTDALAIKGAAGMGEAIRRANLYREAGADCLFPPGAATLDAVSLLAREIQGPVNIVMGLGNAAGNARAYIEAGIRRVSVGGSIARAAMGLIRDAARELSDQGTVTYAKDQMPQSELNALFAKARAL